jgi:hypothetical protein
VSGQWVAVDAFFPGSTLYGRLKAELGPAGPLAWVNLLCWAKQSSRDGTVKFITPHDALAHLGLADADLGEPSEDWLERFWKLLATMKQARRKRSRSTYGATQKVCITNYTLWQEDRRRENAAERQRRSRAKNERDNERDNDVTSARHQRDCHTSDSDSDSDLKDLSQSPLKTAGAPPPHPAEKSSRKNGTNPRTTGANPRAAGTNPRSNGTNPRTLAAEAAREPIPDWKPEPHPVAEPVDLPAATAALRANLGWTEPDDPGPVS